VLLTPGTVPGRQSAGSYACIFMKMQYKRFY
jgi:hypothetical protein